MMGPTRTYPLTRLLCPHQQTQTLFVWHRTLVNQPTLSTAITMQHDDEDHTATVDGEEEFDEEEDYESDEHIEEEEDVNLIDDEEDDSTSSAADVTGTPTVTTTVPSTPTTTTPIVRSDAIVEAKKPAALDDSRRLFQRLWTDEDEIELLQGFLDYTTQRGTNSSHHHHDTTAFYDQIKGKLQLDFNKNQLVEKIRRLKKKYRTALGKMSSGKECVFKSPHDQATFDICCKIWSEPVAIPVPAAADSGGIDDEEAYNPNPHYSPNVSLNLNENNVNEIGDPNWSDKKVPRPRKRSKTTGVKFEESNIPVTPNVVEETVKGSVLPLFKELVNSLRNGPSGDSRGLGLMNMNPFGGSMNVPIGDMSDEKWRKQHILELEVYAKRIELMQDQVKSRLEELRSMGN